MSALDLNSAFESDAFKSQLSEWALQERRMRTQLKEWVAEHGEGFKIFWSGPQQEPGAEQEAAAVVIIVNAEGEEERGGEADDGVASLLHTALIATALEEVPSSIWGSLVTLVCPEVAHLAELVQMEAVAQWRSQLWDLLHVVLRGQENTSARFDQTLVYEMLRHPAGSDAQGLNRPMFAVKSLALVRSCILLQLFTTIAHCWLTILADQAEAAEDLESVGHDDVVDQTD